MSVYSDVNEIRAQALTIDPVRMLLAVLAFPFVALLYVLRYAWLAPAFAIAAGRHGWAIADEQIRRREAEARSG